MDDIAGDALMDCVDKLDERKLKGKSNSSILNKLPIILKMAKESGGHVLLTEEGISVKFE